MLNVIKSLGLSKVIEVSKASKTGAQVVQGWMTFSVVNALHENGFIDSMRNNNKMDVKAYCSANALSYENVKPCFDFLYREGFVDAIDESSFKFSKKGKRLAELGMGFFTLPSGYSGIFNNLTEIMRGKVKYNKDVFRDGRLVGKGSGEIASMFVFPFIQNLILEQGYKHVLDLGCGDAQFLIDTCKKLGVNGYGIDISKDVIDFANKRLQEEGLTNNIHVYHGDIKETQSIPFEDNEKIDLILSSYVLHEFFYKDDEGVNVKNILDGLHKKFPKAKVLIVELVRQSDDAAKSASPWISSHHLWHDLAEQGLPSLPHWEKTFVGTPYEVEKIYQVKPAAQAFMLLKPISKKHSVH